MSWQLWRTVLLLVLVSLVTGPLVVLGLNWSAFSTYAKQLPISAERAPQPTHAPSLTATPAALVVAAPLSLTPAQTPAPPHTTSAAAKVVQAVSPMPTPQPPPTFTPTPLPLPNAEQAWSALQPSLDMAWGVDSQTTIALLDGFYARFPDYQPAREKLYAALLANANDLARGGAPDAAAELLTRATAIAPERAEGLAALQALTPTARPVLRPQAPAPTRPAPTPVPRPVVVPPPPPAQALPPTPTKIPFRPPSGP